MILCNSADLKCISSWGAWSVQIVIYKCIPLLVVWLVSDRIKKTYTDMSLGVRPNSSYLRTFCVAAYLNGLIGSLVAKVRRRTVPHSCACRIKVLNEDSALNFWPHRVNSTYLHKYELIRCSGGPLLSS